MVYYVQSIRAVGKGDLCSVMIIEQTAPSRSSGIIKHVLRYILFSGFLCLALAAFSGCFSDPQPQPDPLEEPEKGGADGTEPTSAEDKDSDDYDNGEGDSDIDADDEGQWADEELVFVSAPEQEAGAAAVAGMKNWVTSWSPRLVKIINSRTDTAVPAICSEDGEFGTTIPAETGDSLKILISESTNDSGQWHDIMDVTVPAAGWEEADGGIPAFAADIQLNAPDSMSISDISISHETLGPDIFAIAANISKPSTDYAEGSADNEIELEITAKPEDSVLFFIVDRSDTPYMASTFVELEVPSE